MENKGLKVSVGILAVLLIVSFIANSNQMTNTGSQGENLAAQNAPSKIEVSIDDDYVKGDPDAPITIVEFSDFECPFCGKFYSQTLPSIQQKYIDTGKVKFVYRDFPLDFHKSAQKAAEAAQCAGDQGKYWEFHDKIFENQPSLNLENLKQWAVDLGLNTNEFNQCLDSGKHYEEVQKDMKDGADAGVRGTPAFFINGVFLSGAQPFSAFEKIIEEELSSL
jgi:protein-disulfide isomerase